MRTTTASKAIKRFLMSKFICFREGKSYDFQDFCKAVASRTNPPFSKDECNGIVTKFSRCKFLKVLKGDKKNNDDHDIPSFGDDDEDEDRQALVEEKYDGKRISFCCVGIIEHKGMIFLIYPKYMREYDGKGERSLELDSVGLGRFKIAFSALRRYIEENKNKDEESISDYDDENESNDISPKLALELSILEDYYENGLYRRFVSETVLNGNGEVDWDRTVNETQPFFKNGRPYYLDLLTNELADDSSNYITRLHEVVLSEISRDMTNSGLSDIFDISGVELTPMTLEDFDPDNSHEYVKYMIELERCEQYVVRMQTVLKYLHDYIDNKIPRDEDSDKLEYFVTNSFHVVWERACQVVFGDCKDAKLKEILDNLKIHNPIPYMAKKTLDGNSDEITFAEAIAMDLIDKPLWKFSEEEKHYASETLKPDVIIVEKKDDDNIFAILDAKYYCYEHACAEDETINGKKTEGTIKSQPGIYSVVKQYAYIDAFEYGSNFLQVLQVKRIINAFVLPMRVGSCQDDNGKLALKKVGFVKLNFLACLHNFDEEAGNVQVIEADPDVLFGHYVSGETFLQELLDCGDIKWRRPAFLDMLPFQWAQDD